MKNRINIIKEIYYARVVDVTSFQAMEKIHTANTVTVRVTETVRVDAKAWHKINRSVAPATLTIDMKKTAAGNEFTSDIGLALKEPVIVPDPVVLRVDLCDGYSLVIGSPELPVFIESNIQLISKRLSISHKSWHYPLAYIV